MPSAFLDCVVDESCFELRRRGKSVRLEPKVFDVLLHLIANCDRVVTKDELLDTLWPGEAVSDSVLPRCIAAMRRAVGDSRTRQQVIATAHGRGYRFVAELKTAGPPEQKTPAPSTPAPAAHDEPVRGRSKLVGRVAPMARLAKTLERTAAGRGGVALIVGEPGIGKTRLTEELEVYAREHGFEVQVGHCYEGEGAPAYWPWV
ncbi:MAG: winged helix-turn-helix domain-containing protein, partial [Myxococcota bacterium]|nr:winged helix-turn-helix domain-containing protein [Myxococcota bacterium]